MKKVLIITYYWPPSGGSGVQRWLKFTKYLPELGWKPIIFTPSNPEYPAYDEGLLKDVPKEAEIVKIPIKEPYQLYRAFTGKKGEKVSTGFLSEKESNSKLENIAKWIRGNLFIPDARKWWIDPASKFLVDYLDKNPVDAIISTGPPHSMHMIAMKVKNKVNTPWIADFRDPWTKIDFYKELNLSNWADKKHHQLEKEVLLKADKVITIGQTMADEFKDIAKRDVDVIYNGYDAEDIDTTKVEVDDKFSVVHTGLMAPSRNPGRLWEVLSYMIKENPDFKKKLVIRLIGKVDVSIKKSVEEFGLTPYTEYIDYMPHEEVIKEQKRAKILLLVINSTPNAKGILTGKMFEYIASQRPILCVGPHDGEAGMLLEKAGHYVAAQDDSIGLKHTLEYLFKAKEEDFIFDKELIGKFERKACTNTLVQLLNELIK